MRILPKAAPLGGGQSPSQPRCLPSAWPRGRLTGGAEGTQGSSYALRCCARGWAPPRSDPQPPGLPAAPQSRPGGPPLGTEPPASGSSAAPLPPRADPAFPAGARRRTPRSRGSLCPSGARTAERIQGPEAEAGARVSLGLVPSPGWAFHEASSVSSCASKFGQDGAPHRSPPRELFFEAGGGVGAVFFSL